MDKLIAAARKLLDAQEGLIVLALGAGFDMTAHRQAYNELYAEIEKLASENGA